MPAQRHITLRTTPITDRQISDLSVKWGENKSQAIIRSIDRAWVDEIRQGMPPEPESIEEAISHPRHESLPTYTGENYELFVGDAKHILLGLETESIDCVVTSPPYYGQRDYEEVGQIGLEFHPQLYIASLVEVFREVKRVLKPTGSVWVNLGDTFWSGKGRAHGKDDKQKHRRFARPQDNAGVRPWGSPKQLLLIPHRFAIAMQDDGWCVRGDNVWYKPNPTPDPVEDRCARSHEYVFHFVKQRHYWFDANAVALPSNGDSELKPPQSVWTVRTVSSNKEHKASFPGNLVSLPLRATLPPKGCLLDPFCGSGTALEYALNMGEGRRAIGIDISTESIDESRAALERAIRQSHNAL